MVPEDDSGPPSQCAGPPEPAPFPLPPPPQSPPPPPPTVQDRNARLAGGILLIVFGFFLFQAGTGLFAMGFLMSSWGGGLGDALLWGGIALTYGSVAMVLAARPIRA